MSVGEGGAGLLDTHSALRVLKKSKRSDGDATGVIAPEHLYCHLRIDSIVKFTIQLELPSRTLTLRQKWLCRTEYDWPTEFDLAPR